MMPEKNVISLIVQCAYSASSKLRRVVEHCPEHARHAAAESRSEVVQQHFGSAHTNNAVTLGNKNPKYNNY